MHNSTIIRRSAIHDPRLSLSARGLLVYLLYKKQHEPDYRPTINDIAFVQGESKMKISRYVRELEKLGYVTRKIVRDFRNRIVGTDWETTDDTKL